MIIWSLGMGLIPLLGTGPRAISEGKELKGGEVVRFD